MPLKSGSSDQTVQDNIEELIKAGHPPDQAAAIAYKKAGRSKRASDQVQMDLGVSDVHLPAALPNYAAGYNLGTEQGQQDAAIVICFDQAGRILTVSRPEPPHEQSIPGGIVEPGESPEEAGKRELHEECGITVKQCTFCKTITSPVDGRKVHVFRAEDWSGNAFAAEPATRVAWLSPENLLAQADIYRNTLEELMNDDLLIPPVSPEHRTDGTPVRPTRRTMAEISTKKRNSLPDSSFALPSKRKYPIHDASHVRNAASRLAQQKKKGKISDGDYATAHAAIERAKKKFGIAEETHATEHAPRRHHFAISADLAHGGQLHITHAPLSDAGGGVAFMPARPLSSSDAEG